MSMIVYTIMAPHVAQNAAQAKRGTTLRVESKIVPPAGSLTGGADTLHEVVGGVERYEFEQQFGYDGRDGRGPGSRFGEWLVRP